MNTLLLVFTVLMAGQGLLSLRDGRRNARYAETYPGISDGDSGPWPAARIFCPVRGAAPDLELNLRSLLEQDHPSFRVTFIVEDTADPAHRVALSLAAGGRADLVVAGPASGRGQKVHNLAVAVERFGPDAEVYAFADADARFPSRWLRELTAPLRTPPREKKETGNEGTENEDAMPGVAATTGYRWYVAPASRSDVRGRGGYWASSFRSAWNASVAGVLGPGSKNFAWGGSMAIRRDVFGRAGVAASWDGAVSDDYALTAAVRRAGMRILFVPSCLVPSYEACDWGELWEFSTRQMKITRVYAPAIFRVALVSYAVFTGTLAALTVALGSGFLAPAFWVGLVGLAAWRGDYRLAAARRTISHPSIETRRWFYRLASPLVAFLFLANSVAALAGRTIEWKGIVYRMKSPGGTEIVRRVPPRGASGLIG